MSNAFGDFGVQPDQGPPLSVPLSFFFVAPVAMIAAGLVVFRHQDVFMWRALPWTMALTHLGSLGFLGAVMLGAMYQMLAVVASPVPLARLGHVVHGLFTIGVASLVWAFLTFAPGGFRIGWLAIGTALVLFIVPVTVALIRATTRTTTVYGLMLAVLGLASVVTMGVIMARTRAGADFPGHWYVWLYSHLTVAAVVWIGGLITAVSWQVVPMFYLTDAYPRWCRVAILAGIATTGLAIATILITGGSSSYVAFAAAPGAVSIWLLHPVVTIRLLGNRRRKRVDDSIHFWRMGLACGPLLLAFATMTWLSGHWRWPILLGWTVVWGWAGLIIAGMLSRIVPFLVWFHRYSWLVGKTAVPPMRRLWPKRHLRTMLFAHATTLVVGLVAIATGHHLAAAATGVGMLVTGVVLFAGLARVTLHMRGKAQAHKDHAQGLPQPVGL